MRFLANFSPILVSRESTSIMFDKQNAMDFPVVEIFGKGKYTATLSPPLTPSTAC